jgi:carbon storage regulator CsrA
MLSLSRYEKERLIIYTNKDGRLGEDSIVISVAEIKQGKVKLGIEAPSDIIVVREELHGEWCDERRKKVKKDK